MLSTVLRLEGEGMCLVPCVMCILFPTHSLNMIKVNIVSLNNHLETRKLRCLSDYATCIKQVLTSFSKLHHSSCFINPP
jgi:hypothetical protein